MRGIKIICISIITLTFLSCNNSPDEVFEQNSLFLDFKPGISMADYKRLAEKNSELTVSKYASMDYVYNLYLDSNSLEVTIHPWFNTKNGGLEGIILKGSTYKKLVLDGLIGMYHQKYGNSTITMEETDIRIIQKSTCYNWDNSKHIRFCVDSLFDRIPAHIQKLSDKIKPQAEYYFRIFYFSSEMSIEELIEKTKREI